jgi:hypothetical protein
LPGGQHDLAPGVQGIPIQQAEKAYERRVKSGVKHRFRIDGASLKTCSMVRTDRPLTRAP